MRDWRLPYPSMAKLGHRLDVRVRFGLGTPLGCTGKVRIRYLDVGVRMGHGMIVVTCSRST